MKIYKFFHITIVIYIFQTSSDFLLFVWPLNEVGSSIQENLKYYYEYKINKYTFKIIIFIQFIPFIYYINKLKQKINLLHNSKPANIRSFSTSFLGIETRLLKDCAYILLYESAITRDPCLANC